MWVEHLSKSKPKISQKKENQSPKYLDWKFMILLEEPEVSNIFIWHKQYRGEGFRPDIRFHCVISVVKEKNQYYFFTVVPA